jgi:hypothetical protein
MVCGYNCFGEDVPYLRLAHEAETGAFLILQSQSAFGTGLDFGIELQQNLQCKSVLAPQLWHNTNTRIQFNYTKPLCSYVFKG